LQEVQRRAFSAKQRAGISLELAEHLSGRQRFAVLRQPFNFKLRVERVETGIEPGRAAEYRRFATDDAGLGGLVWRDQAGGQVAVAGVFMQRTQDIAAYGFFQVHVLSPMMDTGFYR